MADDSKRAPAPTLQVQMDEQTAQGQYTNLVLINHSDTEFVLDFAFAPPGGAGRAQVLSRIISSPRHTKRLLLALQKNLERFEDRFGVIDMGDGSGDSVVH